MLTKNQPIIPTHHVPTIQEVQTCYDYIKAEGGSIPVGCLGAFELMFYFSAILRAANEVYQGGRVYWQIKDQPNLDGLTK